MRALQGVGAHAMRMRRLWSYQAMLTMRPPLLAADLPQNFPYPQFLAASHLTDLLSAFHSAAYLLHQRPQFPLPPFPPSSGSIAYQVRLLKPLTLPSIGNRATFSTESETEAEIRKEALRPLVQNRSNSEKGSLEGPAPKYKIWKVTRDGGKTEEEIPQEALVGSRP